MFTPYGIIQRKIYASTRLHASPARTHSNTLHCFQTGTEHKITVKINARTSGKEFPIHVSRSFYNFPWFSLMICCCSRKNSGKFTTAELKVKHIEKWNHYVWSLAPNDGIVSLLWPHKPFPRCNGHRYWKPSDTVHKTSLDRVISSRLNAANTLPIANKS